MPTSFPFFYPDLDQFPPLQGSLSGLKGPTLASSSLNHSVNLHLYPSLLSPWSGEARSLSGTVPPTGKWPLHSHSTVELQDSGFFIFSALKEPWLLWSYIKGAAPPHPILSLSPVPPLTTAFNSQLWSWPSCHHLLPGLWQQPQSLHSCLNDLLKIEQRQKSLPPLPVSWVPVPIFPLFSTPFQPHWPHGKLFLTSGSHMLFPF